MKKRFVSFVITMFAVLTANALEIPEIFGDNMVLQQQTKAKLWGWAEANHYIKVTMSWSADEYITKVDADGSWKVQVKTPEASFNKYSVTISEYKTDPNKDKKVAALDTKVSNGVLIGEVWFCSGQSNMEMPLGGFWNCPIEGANETIAQSGKYRNSVRVATIPKVGKPEPQNKVEGKWEIPSPKIASRFSACGYYFATTLADMLDVPVGIINCSWGGSCVEGWLPKDTLLTYPDGLTPVSPNDYHQRMVMFNGMLNPLAGYTIKGFLWNQGESNVGYEKQYIERFKTMTRLWRKMWNQPNDKLPIYTVELPPYWYDDVNGTQGADFRAAQHVIAKELEYCGCVCTSDLVYDYEAKQIHGAQKRQIGQRLAYMALARDYGVEGISAEAPVFEYMEEVDANTEEQAVIAGTAVGKNPNAKGKVLHLYFKNGDEGFDRLDNIEGFEAQDVDGKWHKAIVWASSAWQNVKRQGCYLTLACPEINDIKGIRYCYKNFIPGKLHNVRGLPVVPFLYTKK